MIIFSFQLAPFLSFYPSNTFSVSSVTMSYFNTAVTIPAIATQPNVPIISFTMSSFQHVVIVFLPSSVDTHFSRAFRLMTTHHQTCLVKNSPTLDVSIQTNI